MSRVHLVNPSSQSFGVGIITPRWLDVLAAATGCRCGDGDVIWPRVVADGFAAELRPIYDGGRLVTARSVRRDGHDGSATRADGYSSGSQCRISRFRASSNQRSIKVSFRRGTPWRR